MKEFLSLSILVYNNFMNPEFPPFFSELYLLKEQIISLEQQNENSVEKIIREAAETHQSIECKY